MAEKQFGYGRKCTGENGLKNKNITQYDGCCEDQAVNLMLAGEVKTLYAIQKKLYHYRIDNYESLIHSLKASTDYPGAIAYGIRYLKVQGKFEKK